MPQPGHGGKPGPAPRRRAAGHTGPVPRRHPRRLPASGPAPRSRLVARRRLGAGLGLVLVVAVVGCVAEDHPEPAATTAPGALIVPTDPGPGPDGSLLASAEVPVPPELGPARAWRVAYRMPGVGGSPVVATGLVVAPVDGVTSDRPVVAWGHPTRGSADGCAPSLEGPAGVPDLARWLAAGVTVVAPDYEGLGGPGPHPYLVGPSEGRSLLWAVVAARRLPGTGVGAGSPVALWGFSQGGHAVAFAAQLAPSEVPDLDLRGVALAAPVSDVAAFARRAEGRDDQIGVLVAIVGGQVAADPALDAGLVLTPEAVAGLGSLETACIGVLVEELAGPTTAVSARPVAEVPAWAEALADDLAGQAPVPAPVLVVQGDADDTVDPADTSALAARWCRLGTEVTLVRRPDGGHGAPTADVVVPWVLDRLAGAEPDATCGRDPVVRALPDAPGGG